MAARNSAGKGTGPSVDGAGPDATTAQAVPAPDKPVDAVLDTQPELRDEGAVRARLQQLAHMAVGTPDDRPIVRNGAPVYPGPMDSPLPDAEQIDESNDIEAGGQQRAQVLFNFYRVLQNDGRRVTARRGQTVKVTVDELKRGERIGGLKAIG